MHSHKRTSQEPLIGKEKKEESGWQYWSSNKFPPYIHYLIPIFAVNLLQIFTGFGIFLEFILRFALLKFNEKKNYYRNIMNWQVRQQYGEGKSCFFTHCNCHCVLLFDSFNFVSLLSGLSPNVAPFHIRAVGVKRDGLRLKYRTHEMSNFTYATTFRAEWRSQSIFLCFILQRFTYFYVCLIFIGSWYWCTCLII